MLSTCKGLIGEERAQGLVEYALILLFVGLAVVGTLKLIAPALEPVFENVSNLLSGSLNGEG